MSGLKVSDVEFCTMPVALGSYGKESFVYPVQSELIPLINEKLNPYVEQVTIRQLDLMSVASDGSLRSSTGRLAEPSLAYPPVVETDPPEESDPIESNPVESGPIESDPIASEPMESGSVQGDPVASQPPESAPIEPDPSATEAGGDAFDWGDTAD